jgi:hypothetical protein
LKFKDLKDKDRAAINRANAQHSTGPKTEAGKRRSSANALKHGLYSSRIVQPHEDPAQYERFRSSLVAEHRPSSPTEEFLVDELAQNGWKIRRLRGLEAHAFSSAHIHDALVTNLLAALARALAAAERAFHRSLAALTKLQRARGFVPAKQNEGAQRTAAAPPVAAFVPVESPAAAGDQPASAASVRPSPPLPS